MKTIIKIVKNGRTFDLILNGEKIQGGFFSRDAAWRAAEEMGLVDDK